MPANSPHMLNTPSLPLSAILVEGRIREDLGDIVGLAESILEVGGLIQPLVVERITHPNYEFALRCGGRRYAALTLLNSHKVPNPFPERFLSAPVHIFDEMPAHRRLLVELEENLRRKGMTWKENVIGIVKYHKAQRQAAALDGEKWSQARTGELLNVDQAAVSVAFTLYDELMTGNEKVLAAESANEAIKIITEERLDRAQAEQMRRIQLKRAEQVAQAGTAGQTSFLTSAVFAPSTLLPGTAHGNQLARLESQPVKEQFTKEQVASFFYHGDALTVLPLLAASGVINHIICDPPYGIDMSNLAGDAAERVKETHDVKQNLTLLPAFLRVAFDSIADDGFLAMWYDLDHHEKIRAWAEDIGWRVQRWPLVWCKTTPCSNGAAQYNITKSTEVCYFFRKSEQSIIKDKRGNNYIVGPNPRNATHPFVKPAYVWDAILDIVASPGQTVVDPFAGEGSSLAPIFKHGCRPIGIELDEKHIASGLTFVQEQLNYRSILDDVMEPPL